jgi:YgiT-type zinc finger domain-containing protein
MECIHCHGTLERGRTSYTVNRKGYHLIIDHVPAWICKQCGEALFDEETVEAIQAMLREVDRQAEALALAAT